MKTTTRPLAERRLEVIRINVARHADFLFTTDPESGVDSICTEALDQCAADIDYALRQLDVQETMANTPTIPCPKCLLEPATETPCSLCDGAAEIPLWNPGEPKVLSAGRLRALQKGKRWWATPPVLVACRIKITQSGEWAKIGSTPGRRSVYPWNGTVMAITDSHVIVHLDPAR